MNVLWSKAFPLSGFRPDSGYLGLWQWQRRDECEEHDLPSDFTRFLLLSMGERFLEAGRGTCGEFLCATAADIALDDEMKETTTTKSFFAAGGKTRKMQAGAGALVPARFRAECNNNFKY